MTIEEFVYKSNVVKDEQDIDELCINWMNTLANDHGRDGQIAKELLKQVKILLDIY
jgi:hypothetical protein